ncbi:MAG: murein DD-endopeptidase MepM [Sodalis sp. (in: enterobacteria)]
MQQISRSFVIAFHHLPRFHYGILVALILITVVVAVWHPYLSIYSRVVEKSPVNHTSFLEEQLLQELTSETGEPLNHSTTTSSIDSNEDIPKDELDEHVEDDSRGMHEYVVIAAGDTLSSFLTQYGINFADLTMLTKQNPVLRNLKIGQSLSWILSAEGDLQRLIWNVSSREIRTYSRVDGGFKESIANITGEWRNTILTGQLDGVFVSSARVAGLTSSDINTVIKALQWQLDFCKLRKGDQFSVLASREILDGKSAQSQLIGIRLRTGNKNYYAFRANDGKFYNQDANGLVGGFMHFPTIKKFRVSSNFNPSRLNPVTGRKAPHLGVDFAVPVGTPVLAVSAGEVIISKMDNIAGNYIAIRHGRQYMTRYMHLKKLLVKQGQKVNRGDCIALSGNTGRSTGPHLHYEVWINQQAANPLTAKLPYFDGLIGRERAEYLAQVEQILPQLKLN